jgi:hypothetical protein
MLLSSIKLYLYHIQNPRLGPTQKHVLDIKLTGCPDRGIVMTEKQVPGISVRTGPAE